MSVVGDRGTWTFQWDRDPTVRDSGGQLGKGVALLQDPGGWTWLAAAAPGADNATGAIYLFALATSQ